ncbi:phosphate signaling complex protein PhoU [Salinirussus salinus]|uniref:phosphate signaling complex protein PhoU n=1 Tax=Salinirussus salinus TaxID=1198300 RepID=UPI001356AE9F|nr:phosphate signaling complex protein PhoU [Salinirussus salinus]
MARDTYQDELDGLREGVLAMGALVTDRLDDALGCLATGDADRARALIEGDEDVNDRYVDLEERCVELYALQQPVASDLRFVTASFKILTDLERVGDLATNLAGYATAGEREPAAGVQFAELQGIGREALALVERALAAYGSGDAAACRQVAADDDEIDALCHRAGETVARDLIEREADGSAWGVEALLDDVSRLLLTIRDIERVGDHAVNIAARTLYMVENERELIY